MSRFIEIEIAGGDRWAVNTDCIEAFQKMPDGKLRVIAKNCDFFTVYNYEEFVKNFHITRPMS